MTLSTPRGSAITGWTVALAGLLGLLTADVSVAAYDPVGSGSIRLILAKPFAEVLAANDVQILVKHGARRHGRAIALPASAGEVDPRLGAGTIEGAGTIAFSNGGRSLPLRDITFEAKRSPLYAKVGGGRLKLATATGLKDQRAGFGTVFSAVGLRLTEKFATRLARKLRLRGVFKSGQMLGAIRSQADPRTVHLREGGRVELTLDQAFKQKLDSLFVSLNPIAPAELAEGPALSFPIGPDSTLSPAASSGTLKLGGSVELLQLGNAQLFWRELWLQPEVGSLLAETDVEPSPPHPGRQPQGPLLGLGRGGAVVSNPSSRRIESSGQPVTLTSAGAASLDDAFAGSSHVFGTGEKVGVVSFQVAAD